MLAAGRQRDTWHLTVPLAQCALVVFRDLKFGAKFGKFLVLQCRECSHRTIEAMAARALLLLLSCLVGRFQASEQQMSTIAERVSLKACRQRGGPGDV